MTTSTEVLPVTETPMALTPDDFCDRLRQDNPFLLHRVTHLDAPVADAGTVHDAPFRQLTSLARQVRQQRCGLGALLGGEAGVGKSHVLARLQRWAGDGREAFFVTLANLQASPDNLARSLLRATLSILTAGRTERLDDTPLGHLVAAAIQAAGPEPDTFRAAEQAFERLVDRLGEAGPALVDRTTYGVLFRFYRSACKGEDGGDASRLAVRWLSGDTLDPEEADRLGLPPGPRREEGMALADDQQIKLVLVALSQAALFAGRPLLLCFDQVDNAEPEQVSALARFLQALLDSAPGLLVVTCGVKDTLLRWHMDRVISEAAWDRIAQFHIDLLRITPHEGKQIVQARLEEFLDPFLSVPAVKERVQHDDLFPLGRAWFDEFLAGKPDLRPRDVITWAREGWERQQRALAERGGQRWLETWGGRTPPPVIVMPTAQQVGELIDHKVTARLRESKELRQREPRSLPADAGNLSGLVYALLQQCLGPDGRYPLTEVQRLSRPRHGPPPAHDLLVKRRTGGDVGLLFVATGSATSAAAYLRRLAQAVRLPDRLLLVTDKRLPLKLGPAGKGYLDELRRQFGDSFQQVELSFEEYADLDALHATAGMARSGDLEVELPGRKVQRVTEAEVLAAHHARDRYASHPLLRLLLVLDASAASVQKPLQGRDEDQDLRQFIMAQLALMPGASSRELAAKYVQYAASTQRGTTTIDACQPRLEEAARRMHREGLAHVTPTDDGLYVLPRTR